MNGLPVSQETYLAERVEAERTVLAAAKHLQQPILELIDHIKEEWDRLNDALDENGQAREWDQDDLFEAMNYEWMSLHDRRHMARAVYAVYDQKGDLSFMSVDRARSMKKKFKKSMPLAVPAPQRLRM